MSAIILEVNHCFKKCVAKTGVHQILGSKPRSFRRKRDNGSKPDLKRLRVGGCVLNASDSNHGEVAVSYAEDNGLVGAVHADNLFTN